MCFQRAGIELAARAAFRVIQAGYQEILAQDLESTAAKQGSMAPEFSLQNATGERVSLQQLLKEGKVVLTFYRGAWCPYCNLHLSALQGRLEAITQLGAQLAAISPQTTDRSHSVVEKNNLRFPVLSDVSNHVACALGLVFEFSNELRAVYKGFGVDLREFNGDDSWTLPVPATFIVNQDGTIAKVWGDVDYRRRAEPDDLVSALRVLSEE